MALASRKDSRLFGARKALASNTVVSAPPASISGTYTQSEVAALRTTVAELRAALVAVGVVKAS